MHMFTKDTLLPLLTSDKLFFYYFPNNYIAPFDGNGSFPFNGDCHLERVAHRILILYYICTLSSNDTLHGEEPNPILTIH